MARPGKHSRLENTDYNFTASVGYSFSDKLRFGGALIGLYSSQVEAYQFSGGEEDSTPAPFPIRKSMSPPNTDWR